MKYYLCFFCFVISCLFTESLRAQKSTSSILHQEILFSPEDYRNVQISPDGRWISFLKNVQNKDVLYFSPTDIESLSPNLVSEADQSVSTYQWSADSKTILFVVKDQMMQKDILYYRSIDNPLYKDKNVRLFETTSIQKIDVGKENPGKVFVQTSGRSPFSNSSPLYQLTLFDNRVHEIEIHVPNSVQYIFNSKDEIQYYITQGHKGERMIVSSSPQYALDTLFEVPFYGLIEQFHWNKESNKFYFLADISPQNLSTHIYEIDSLGEVRQLELKSTDKNLKFNNILIDDARQEIVAYQYQHISPHTQWLSSYWKGINDSLQKQFPNKSIQILNLNSTHPKIYFWVSSDVSSPELFQYVLSTNQSKLILIANSSINKIQRLLSTSKEISYTSIDGTNIYGTLTYPSQQKAKNLPLVIWVQNQEQKSNSIKSYEPDIQFLASRGYAVLQIYCRKIFPEQKNIYSSTLEDIQAGVQFMIQTKTISPERIAIMGKGLGGYFATAAVTYLPHLFKAGVNLLGTNDLFYSYYSVPDQWEEKKRNIQYLYGHGVTDSILLKYSPSQFTENIQTPLFIAQDSSHQDVSLQEIKKMVIQLFDRKIPVEYLLTQKENFQTQKNQRILYSAIEQFLMKNIGGKAIEISESDKSAIQHLSIQPEVLKSSLWTIQEADTFPTLRPKFRASDLFFQVTYEYQGEKRVVDLQRLIYKSNNRWVVWDNFKDNLNKREEQVFYTPDGQVMYVETNSSEEKLQTTFGKDSIYFNDFLSVYQKVTPQNYLAQVAGLDMIIGDLALEKYYHSYLLLFQPYSKSFQLVDISVVTEEEYNHREHFVVKITNTANTDDYTLLWINKESRQMSKSIQQISDKGNLRITIEKK
ncbi:MAG: prolyl oligopeptidase family serine peptidase [Chitinophagales bacterium]|nr:prolyl oligopeptidase family serine peptidase [Chitinophagales bacterium]